MTPASTQPDLSEKFKRSIEEGVTRCSISKAHLQRIINEEPWNLHGILTEEEKAILTKAKERLRAKRTELDLAETTLRGFL